MGEWVVDGWVGGGIDELVVRCMDGKVGVLIDEGVGGLMGIRRVNG